MEHGNQIEKLIEYAENSNGYPLYLLYNYVETIPNRLNSNAEFHGCTLVDAYHLRETYYNRRIKRKRDGSYVNAWIIPDFNDLHPAHAFPWHELVCDINDPSALLQKILTIADQQRRIGYRTDLLTSDGSDINWSNYPGFIGKQDLSFDGWFRSKDKDILKSRSEKKYAEVENESYDKQDYTFNPQTRIVITI
jgi:hypothetical protein